MQNIYFLIGAGFSYAAGYPTAKGLSDKIKAAIEQKNDNEPICMFLKAYKKTNEAFNYESFYDWINGWGRLDEECYKNINDDISKHSLDEGFKVINQSKNLDQLQSEARTEFDKLVTSNLLDVNAKSSCYAAFTDFISRLNRSKYTVDIYTLNHDLLMEKLLNGRIKYSDGYSSKSKNSISYGFGSGKRKEASVFDDRFDSNTRLYRLHGSLDWYWIGELVTSQEINGKSLSVKVDRAYGLAPEFYLRTDSDRIIRYATYLPDFLTGVETKKLYYRFTPYCGLFERFNQNIKHTGALFIIGYSFCDEKINEIIKQLPPSKPIIAACREDNGKVVKLFPNNSCHPYWDFAAINYSELLSILAA